MSDSDDTDILLLIPPNFFLTHIEEEEFAELPDLSTACVCAYRQRDQLNTSSLLDAQFREHLEYNFKALNMNASTSALEMPPPTAAYQFLPQSKKAELNEINARLQNFEHGTAATTDCHYAAPSDISTISNCTQANQRPLGVVHSTPKYSSEPRSKYATPEEPGVLLEIDNFLGEHQQEQSSWKHCNGSERRTWQLSKAQQQQGRLDVQTPLVSSMPDGLNQLPEERTHRGVQFERRTPPLDGNLISLSEIWGKSGQGTAIACTGQATLREEQLRRHHLERTVHGLQSRLLEYQQRLSVAVEVDRTKDAALHEAQRESKSLESEVHRLRDTLSNLEREQREHNSKMDAVQQELAQALSLAAKFQEKNEKLESELMATSRKSNECTNMYKQQVEELEIKIHGCKRSEEFAINELNKLKDKLAKAEYENEKLKLHSDELEKNYNTLKDQKEMLQAFHHKQKNRADSLETQKKSLQETLANLTETETTLKRKIEIQAKSLKTHYQQQLENVVAQKVKEYQEQLDKTEEQLKSEARERERLLAERAVKQLELINEKSELELNLLQEKHNEEVELYRIQLANASKKIDDLEQKLSVYKTRRADIAEKLHGVMEAQWQKALEILTSPNNRTQQSDTDAVSPDDNEQQGGKSKDNHAYETPKTSKMHDNKTNKNNLNCENDRKVQTEQKDRLQAYIELLLSKSPGDFDKLDEILALTKLRNAQSKSARKRLSSGSGKPPWRA